ncbi:mercuric ion transport protein [Nitrosomonas aestuarii]|nr:mercuric transporter MerT family protein [Nitrosomonas aestuarii]PTN07645.1 mercuric ion transport protein [Nitrosomonas aestuarii]
MSSKQQIPPKEVNWLGIGTILATIGASICCVGPLLLLSLGIGGAWMSTLTSMETVRPFFLILTLIFIGLGYRKLYLIPERCEEGEACASPDVKQKQRVIFWIGSGLILLLLALPWYVPYFIA